MVTISNQTEDIISKVVHLKNEEDLGRIEIIASEM